MVDIGLRVLTRPDPLALPAIYRRLGMDFDDKVLPSIVTEVVKQVIAQFNATALLTQREQVSRRIKSLLEERAKEFHIILEDVSITDLKFGETLICPPTARPPAASRPAVGRYQRAIHRPSA